VKKEIQNTLLVDGNALFKTGFRNKQCTTEMVCISVELQFFTTLRKMLTDELYHRVYVFWDGNYAVYSDMSYTNL
jgi:hypothetical protein